MPQIQEKSVDKCDSDASAVECDQNDENNSTNTLTFVKKRLKSFTIRRKVKIDDKIDMSQCTDSDEPSGKSKITIRKIFRKSSIRKFINNLQNFTNFTNGSGSANSSAKNERVPPINNINNWPDGVKPGVIGLRNHGNTCFMNACLQCLSHTDILAEYFVLDQYKADLRKRNKLNSRKFGTKGELTEQLAQVLKALWTCKDASECSTSFKEVVERYGSQFKSSNTQHDAQEFLFWLLDKVHEDLNTASKRKYKNVKNNYGRPDEIIAAETLANYVRCNNSFVQAVFRAQFRSSLKCPMCHKQSNTFDPFHCVSVQLPQLSLQSIKVNVLYDTKTPKQINMLVQVPHGSSVLSLREKLQHEAELNDKLMILTEVASAGFGRLFCDSHPLSNIESDDTVYCIELPDKIEESQVALCVMNVNTSTNSRFGSVFCMKMNRDVTFIEFQKSLLRQMSPILKPDVFSYSTPISEMFKVHLQEPSADPGTYLEEKYEHPLLTEMIDLALSVQPTDSGPGHIKLSLEWSEPEKYFTDMSDPIVEHESVANAKEKEAVSDTLTLEQCLDHYTKAETLSDENSWRCPNCAKYLPVIKTLGLWSLPDILVVHFKRFRQQQSKASKITTMVNFPLTDFELSTWLAGGATAEPPSSVNSTLTRKLKKGSSLPRNFANEDQRYDLYAVCYHQGDTLETGHYTAACKNPYDQQWYKFDDQRVTMINSDEVVENVVNDEAYMLFYQRRSKNEGSDSSGASTSSSEHWVSKITPTPAEIAVKAPTIAVPETETVKSEMTVDEENVEVKVERDNDENSGEVAATASPINLDDIKAIDGDDDEDVVAEVNNDEGKVKKAEDESSPIVKSSEDIFEDAREEKSVPPTPVKEMQNNNNASSENKITIQVEITRSSPSPSDVLAIDEESTSTSSLSIPIQVTSRDKNSNDMMHEITDDFQSFDDESEKLEEMMSKQTISTILWNDANNNNNRHSDVGAITISDLLSMERIDEITSSSLPKNYMMQETDSLTKRIRSVSSCSKDTLLYIDQQGILEDESLLENRAHWISPVTPHKLITVSPKN